MPAQNSDNLDNELIQEYQDRLKGKIVPIYVRAFAFLADFGIKGGLVYAAYVFILDKITSEPRPILVASIVGLIYEVLFLYSGLRATPGKMFFGIIVVNHDGKKLSLIRSFYRFLCRYFSVYIFGIGVLAAYSDALKRTFHCSLSRTYVVFAQEKKAREDLLLDEDL